MLNVYSKFNKISYKTNEFKLLIEIKKIIKKILNNFKILFKRKFLMISCK